MIKYLLSLFGYNTKPIVTGRSSRWPKTRAKHLRSHRTCEVCGTSEYIIVHHIVPVHIDPSRELDPENLITLCETPTHNDHLLIGHLLDMKSWNKDVKEDAALLLNKIKNKPKQ